MVNPLIEGLWVKTIVQMNVLDAQHTLDKVSKLNQQIDDITSEMDYLKQALESLLE